MSIWRGPLIPTVEAPHGASDRELLGHQDVADEVKSPVAFGRGQDDPTAAADQIECGEQRLRVVGGDITTMSGLRPIASAMAPPSSFSVDGQVGAEPLGQLEPVTIVGQTGDTDPPCAGRLAAIGRQPSGTGAEDEDVLTILEIGQLNRPGMPCRQRMNKGPDFGEDIVGEG